MTPDRRAELADGLAATRARIANAAAAAGRDPGEITLIVVTKFFPPSDVSILAELGVGDMGENRDQDARTKVEAFEAGSVRVHFIGQLQTNKAASVARYADAVHSVDRTSLVDALGRAARVRTSPLGVLIQVGLDTSGPRGGAAAHEVPELAAHVERHEGLVLRGVMGIAPLDEDPAPAFSRLQAVSHDLRAQYPEATWLSAGMSGDIEEAVAFGATHLRVGSAILGSRPPRR